jgi:hypothetical protein
MRFALLLALALVFTASSSAQESAGLGDETTATADNDPIISPEEVVAPAVDWDDPAWEPAYERFEDPESLDCGGRDACEEVKGNATGDAQ